MSKPTAKRQPLQIAGPKPPAGLLAPPTSPAPAVVLEPYTTPTLREEPVTPPPAGDCSYFVCSADPAHRWPPKLGVAACGCQANQPVVAARFTNCPICNEPPRTLRVRVDLTTMAIGIAQRCRGQDASSVTGYAELTVAPSGAKETRR